MNGICNKNDRCKFAHGVNELRKPTHSRQANNANNLKKNGGKSQHH